MVGVVVGVGVEVVVEVEVGVVVVVGVGVGVEVGVVVGVGVEVVVALTIKVDLAKIGIPTASELEAAGYDSELDYFRDMLRLNPQVFIRYGEITLGEDE